MKHRAPPPSPIPGGKPLPVKPRFMQAGALVFVPTLRQRWQILLGYNVKVSVTQIMQHNPGLVEAYPKWEVTKQCDFTGAKETKPLAEAQADAAKGMP